jgi:carboxypeptidase C (cathepsin A)
MPIKDATDEVEARIFYVAYTLDNSGPVNERSVIFSFNGGLGSASV